MSTYTNTVKNQTGADTSFAPVIAGGLSTAASSFASAIAGGLAAVSSSLAARAERARVYRELSRMSDRDLEDIGICRSDIERVASLVDFPR